MLTEMKVNFTVWYISITYLSTILMLLSINHVSVKNGNQVWHYSLYLALINIIVVLLKCMILKFWFDMLLPWLQTGKLKFFGTHPKWVVSCIAYAKFHSPRPVFHSPDQIFARIGERASASFPAWIVSRVIIDNWSPVSKCSNIA